MFPNPNLILLILYGIMKLHFFIMFTPAIPNALPGVRFMSGTHETCHS